MCWTARHVSISPLTLVQFLVKTAGTPTILWCDFMKCGRLNNTDVNDMAELLTVGLHKRPEQSCAVVIAPYLTSEKVTNGHRGELRLSEGGGSLWVLL